MAFDTQGLKQMVLDINSFDLSILIFKEIYYFIFLLQNFIIRGNLYLNLVHLCVICTLLLEYLCFILIWPIIFSFI